MSATIAVTPEMRKAGAEVLLASDYAHPVRFQTDEELAARIFTAMVEAWMKAPLRRDPSVYEAMLGIGPKR